MLGISDHWEAAASIADLPIQRAVFGMAGHWEIVIILFIVLLLFGPKNLPKLSKSMGQAIRDFKSGLKNVDEDLEAMDEDDDPVDTKAEIEHKEQVTAAQSTNQAAADEKGADSAG